MIRELYAKMAAKDSFGEGGVLSTQYPVRSTEWVR
jgi:hypothetical protein